jgi:hypothetical protein
MRILIILCIAWSLAACSQAPKQTPKAGDTATYANQATVQINVAKFVESFGSLTPQQQKAMRESLSERLSIAPDDWQAKLKFALAYALPSSTFHNEEKAEALLAELAVDTRLTQEATALVHLTRDFLAESQKAAQVLQEAQKRNLQLQQKSDGLKQKTEQLQQKMDALQSQNQLLEQKLEALKKIEQTMGNRNRRLN